MNGYPVLKRPEGTSSIIEFGATGIICIDHKGNVVKAALKFNLDGCADDIVEAKRFDEEFARLCIEREKVIYEALPKNPYILGCIAITNNGLHFPYMAFGNLRQYLQSHNKDIPSELRHRWIKMASSSIALIHSFGIIHADISARNFLVADDLSLKLCDFSGSGFCGQDPLVSEEDRYHIARDSPRSVKTDIFALGCLAFEITTGLRPYDEIHDSDDEEIENRYRSTQFPPLDGIPNHAIIHKCWTCEYSNVSQLLNELNGELEGYKPQGNLFSSVHTRIGTVWRVAKRSFPNFVVIPPFAIFTR
ncbi:hypothetical protein N7486_009621 [Penicillium sp. IBT 16267x]|nr:hypothetical protein N7486_009621 [Penicillium sp. IBT 16267x]